MKKNDYIMTVDISGLKAEGSILDMGFKSSGIIYRALKNIEQDCQIAADVCGRADDGYGWVYGYPPELPFDDNTFDIVIAFFSLSYLDKKLERNRTIAQISRILKCGGRLLIWDADIKNFNLKLKKRLKVILPQNEEVETYIRMPVLWGGYDMNAILPALHSCFEIIDSYDTGSFFYIESVKRI